MKIFTDSHHAGLFRSLYLTFHEELGHEIYFPDISFATWACGVHPGVWLGLDANKFKTLGGIKSEYIDNFPWIMDKEKFLSTNWDYIISTRTESCVIFDNLINQLAHKPIKIYQIGNEGAPFPLGWDNILSSDLSSYNRAVFQNKFHYSQQLGRQFSTYYPVENLNKISTFVNCLHSFGTVTDALSGYTYQVYPTWSGLKHKYPNINFCEYGIGNENGFLDEISMPEAYKESFLTLGGKHYEGYGHSLLQAYSMGRICVVPKGFCASRTLGKYLINNKTCFEVDWTVAGISNLIDSLNLNTVNEMSKFIFEHARANMDWSGMAQQVNQWMMNCK